VVEEGRGAVVGLFQLEAALSVRSVRAFVLITAHHHFSLCWRDGQEITSKPEIAGLPRFSYDPLLWPLQQKPHDLKVLAE